MKIRKQDTNEVRLALLEQSIYNINETLIRFEKKFDKIDDKLDFMDKKLEKKMEVLEINLGKKMETLEINVTTKLEIFNGRLWSNFYWLLGAMFTLSCAGAGILAKGFGWFN